jgi:2-dehydro-3-deoxyphosphooctonate aldolase (KDO 8-P synthase)
MIYAAISIGIDAIFLEVHPDLDNAISDCPNQLELKKIDKIVKNVVALHKFVNTVLTQN